MKRKDKPIGMRFMSAIGSFALVGASGYMLFSSINLVASTIFIIAILSICVPVMSQGGSIAEIVVGVFEAFIDGIREVIEAIFNLFSF